MLISRNWLQTYFKDKLPSAEKLTEGLTNHAFEIEEVLHKAGDIILEVKVLPNRAHDCLSHYGVAKEVSAIFSLPLSRLPFASSPKEGEKSKEWEVTIDTKKVYRFHGALVKGVKVKESPAWLKERIEAMGGRSINNVVDITNFVMFDIGQPMHAFDAAKVGKKNRKYSFVVRESTESEKVTTLDGTEHKIPEGVVLITNGVDEGKTILGIGGIKGGMSSGITEETTDIILEAANFDAETIRKGSKLLGIRTDASARFENGLAPELPGYAVSYALTLLEQEARGDNFEIEGFVDTKNYKPYTYKVGVSVEEVNRVLGTSLSEKEIRVILERLTLPTRYSVVEEVLKESIPETLGKAYKGDSGMRVDAPDFFSCSSLVSYLYVQAGVYMPSISIDKYVYSEKIGEGELTYGDLIFANTNEGRIYTESVQFIPGTSVSQGIDHVGMCLGNGKVLHATRSQGEVVEEEIKESNQFKKIVGYGRLVDIKESRFIVDVPFERLDLRSREDLIDEIGRIYGLEHIPSILPDIKKEVEINKEFYVLDTIRTVLKDLGFSEVYTYTMIDRGEVKLENPLASDKNFMRPTLRDGLTKSLTLNMYNASLLGLETIKLFEIGKVFNKDEEYLSLGFALGALKERKNRKEIEETLLAEALSVLKEKLAVDESLLQTEFHDGVAELVITPLLNATSIENIHAQLEGEKSKEVSYKSFSVFPFALRDIALFVPETIESTVVRQVIEKHAGEYLVRLDQFDEFLKEGKISYAYHLVFQSKEKTLTEEEINATMRAITSALYKENGWQVR